MKFFALIATIALVALICGSFVEAHKKFHGGGGYGGGGGHIESDQCRCECAPRPLPGYIGSAGYAQRPPQHYGGGGSVVSGGYGGGGGSVNGNY